MMPGPGLKGTVQSKVVEWEKLMRATGNMKAKVYEVGDLKATVTRLPAPPLSRIPTSC